MLLSRKSLFVCSATLALFMASAAQAKKIDNPEYKQWSKFKAGAHSKMDGTTVAAGTSTKQTITTKLAEITADKAVVEVSVSMDMMGQKMDMPAQKREIVATIEVPDTAPTAPPAAGETPKVEAKTSEETVKVAGKDVKCHVTEAETEANGMKTHSKTWTSDEVPGGVVKMEGKTAGAMESTTTMTLVDFTTGG